MLTDGNQWGCIPEEKRTGARSWIILLLWMALGTGCRPGTPSPSAEASPGLTQVTATVKGGIIGPGDVLTIRVYQEADLTGDYRVETDGTLHFPFLGQVPVKDHTPSEIGVLLAERLRQGWLVNPEVSVFVKEFNSRKVFVFGQVKNPGTFTFTDGMTIIQAITLAGGFTPSALRNRTSVARTAQGMETREVVLVDRIADGSTPNYPLLPGDIVFIPDSPL